MKIPTEASEWTLNSCRGDLAFTLLTETTDPGLDCKHLKIDASP
jgi:hypothetical protein